MCTCIAYAQSLDISTVPLRFYVIRCSDRRPPAGPRSFKRTLKDSLPPKSRSALASPLSFKRPIWLASSPLFRLTYRPMDHHTLLVVTCDHAVVNPPTQPSQRCQTQPTCTVTSHLWSLSDERDAPFRRSKQCKTGDFVVFEPSHWLYDSWSPKTIMTGRAK